MVGKIIWQQLKKLAECDEAIAATKKSISILEEEHTERLYAVEDLEEELYEQQQAGQKEKKNVALQELYAKELADRLATVKAKMDQVTHKKELEALEHEVAEIVRKQEVHEGVLMKAWQERDKGVQRQDEQKKIIEERTASLKQGAASYEEQFEKLKTKLVEQETCHRELMGKLDEAWSVRYERIRNTVKDPVIPLIQNSCSSCFYLVASKDLVALKRDHIISCRNCYRFIYQDEAPAVESEKSPTV